MSEYNPSEPSDEDIAKQDKALERFIERGDVIKKFKGGIVRRPKSLREISRETGISRYKIKKQLEQEGLYTKEMARRGIEAGYKRTEKSVSSTMGKASSLAKKIKRAYIKTAKWANTRQKQGGGYRNPQEYEGKRSGGIDEPKFHVGTYDANKVDILDLRNEKTTPLLLKNPIKDQTEKPLFANMLDLTNNQVRSNNLLDLSTSNSGNLLNLRKKEVQQ